MLTRKARARARLEGAAHIVRHLPAAAALMALKQGQGVAGAVVAFDGIAAMLIGRLDLMHEAAGADFDVSPDLFDLPDWNALAAQFGENLDAVRFRAMVDKSREQLGFNCRTFLGLATVTES